MEKVGELQGIEHQGNIKSFFLGEIKKFLPGGFLFMKYKK